MNQNLHCSYPRINDFVHCNFPNHNYMKNLETNKQTKRDGGAKRCGGQRIPTAGARRGKNRRWSTDPGHHLQI